MLTHESSCLSWHGIIVRSFCSSFVTDSDINAPVVYVGSTRVGKIVYAAAAKHLTPVTLELGGKECTCLRIHETAHIQPQGKSPVFVDANCDMKTAAKRLLWGRAANCGQICVSPDYVLIPHEAQDRFAAELENAYHSFFPDGIVKSEMYARMVSVEHAKRVKKYLDDSKGTLVFGGDTDVEAKYVGLTVLKDVSLDDSTMQEYVVLCSVRHLA